MAMHNHHLGITGSAHPTNLEAAKEEYATVIKHVTKRDVLSSFLPVGVNCKRLPNLESHSIKLQSSGLVLSPMRSQGGSASLRSGTALVPKSVPSS